MKKLVGIWVVAIVAFAAENDSFRLSMENVRGTVAAIKGLVETLSADPALEERFRLERKKIKEDTNGRDSMSMTAELMMAKEPKIAAVYRKAGISPKTAGMTMETIAGVAIGSAMAESAGTKVKLPPGFVTDNLEFYKQNKAAIHAALGELQSVSGKLKADPDEENEDENEKDEK